MASLSTEDLKRKIQEKDAESYILQLDGFVCMKIKTKKIKIEENMDYIIIYNLENNDEILKLNKHQIMMIEERGENVKIKFDAGQNVEIQKLF